MAQTVIVKKFRPLKLLSVICGVIAVILLIIALAGVWLKTSDGQVSDSLWITCEYPSPCKNPESTNWLNAVRVFAILSLLLCVVAIVFRVLSIIKGDQNLRWARPVSIVLMIFAMLSIIIALIVFPVKTLDTLPYRLRTFWLFHWAYGVAWGGVIFMIGFIILLLIPDTVDKSEDPAKKIYYVNNAGQFETHA